MKTINTLAIAAFTVTLVAYFFTMGAPSAPAESANAPAVVDYLPPEHRSAPAPVREKPHSEIVLDAKPGPNPVLEALKSNDVCSVQKLKQEAYAFSKNDSLALLETIDPSPELREILAVDGPLLGTKVKKSKSPGVKLLWALRQGSLCGRCAGGPMEDLAGAHQALLELEKAEPGNAAYPFFRLAVETKQHLPVAERTKTAEAVANASYFDNHLGDADAELLRARTLSPSHFILFRSIEYYLQMRPNMNAAVGALSSEELHLPISTREAIGRTLMEKAVRSNGDMYSGEYNPEEYDAGRMLMQDETIPAMYQLSEQRGEERGTQPFPQAPAIFRTEDGKQECDSREFEEFFYANSGRYFY